MEEKKRLKRWLKEAIGARHRLLIGEREVTVSVGGYGATTYAQTDLQHLNAYISRLQQELAVLEGRGRRRPLYIAF